MPFIPIPPDRQPYKIDICRHPEHNPPSMMVITEPCMWQCPGCGATVMLYPKIVTMAEADSPYYWRRPIVDLSAAPSMDGPSRSMLFAGAE
jgi:hypothetical protein